MMRDAARPRPSVRTLSALVAAAVLAVGVVAPAFADDEVPPSTSQPGDSGGEATDPAEPGGEGTDPGEPGDGEETSDPDPDENVAEPERPASGSVTSVLGEGGIVAGDVAVTVFRRTDDTAWDRGSTVEVTDGLFTLPELEDGEYTLFFDVVADSLLVDTWWGGAAEQVDAATFLVVDGAQPTGLDVVLAAGARVTGTVGAAGTPLDETVEVSFFRASTGDGDDTVWTLAATTQTDAAAQYTSPVLPGGSYRVRYAPVAADSALIAQWWAATEDEAQASAIELEAGQIRAGDDALNVDLSIGTLSLGDVTITGKALTGATLTAQPGAWAHGVTVTYQWRANGVAIAGATAPTFAIPTSLGGRSLSVEVAGVKGPAGEAKVSEPLAIPAAKASKAGAVTVSGTAAIGKKLTAKSATWASGTGYRYQWLADGKAISGATASTLTVTASHAEKKLSVKVTGVRLGYTDASRTSAATTKVLRAATPAVSGALAVGVTVGLTRGTWSSGTSFAYQWYADGTKIAGATRSTFTITSKYKAKQLSVAVTGRKSGYATTTLVSAATPKILTVGTVTITGTAATGSTLKAAPGTWTSGTALTYQWYANGAEIAGATRSTLTLAKAQVGKSITVKVTGRKTGYAGIRMPSRATAKVALAATPVISGTVKVGKKLTAKPGTWTSGTVFSYQWYVSGKAIKGATKSTFTVTSGQKGTTLTVKVTGKKPGYATVAKTSKASAKVS